MDPVLISLLVGILGLLFVGYTAQQVLRREQGTKATSAPSLNILIKLMSIVSLVFASLFGAGFS